MKPQNDNTFLIFSVVSIIIIAGVIILALTGVFSPKISTAKVEIAPLTYDFGDIKINGGKVEKGFTISNKSDENVILNEIRTSCMCTEATVDGQIFGMHGNPIANINLNAGETKEMKVTFDPLAHGPDAIGPVTRDIYITTNSKNSKNLAVRINANVIR